MPFPSTSEIDSKVIELLKTLVGFDTTSYNSNLELIEFIQSYLSSYDIDGAWVPEPWATMLVQDLDGVRLFNEEKLWPNEQFASVLLIVRTDYLENEADALGFSPRLDQGQHKDRSVWH